jgi:hypothetical protein
VVARPDRREVDPAEVRLGLRLGEDAVARKPVDGAARERQEARAVGVGDRRQTREIEHRRGDVDERRRLCDAAPGGERAGKPHHERHLRHLVVHVVGVLAAPCSPNCSPWSAVTMTSVRCARPSASRPSRSARI